MKRLTKLALCGLLFAVFLSGCSKKEEGTPPSQEEASTEEATSKAPEASQEAVDWGKITKLGEYKGVEVEKMPTEVADEEVEARIQSILDANPEYVAVTGRAAKDGDVVNIDFKGLKDGVAFDGGSSEGYELELGSGAFIDGFEEGLVGAKAGEERKLDLTFPDNYGNAELAGQPVVFEVKVNRIEEKKDAVLDENFVQRMSDFNTVEEFREDLVADMEEEKKKQSEEQLENDVLLAVVEASEFELNEAAVEEDYNQQLAYYTSIAGMYSMTLEDYATAIGMTEDSFKEVLRSSAEQSAKQQLVAKAVAEKEGMAVETADREAVALENGMDVQTMQQTYGEEAVDQTALLYKVVTFLKDNAAIK